MMSLLKEMLALGGEVREAEDRGEKGEEEKKEQGVNCSLSVSLSLLLGAAGGSWQRERARPGSDHCDTRMEIFTTAVELICMFY